MSEETTELFLNFTISDELVYDTNLATAAEVIFWLRVFEKRILESIDNPTEAV